MQFKSILILICILFIQSSILVAQPLPFSYQEEKVDIFVNNRVLAKVNNRAITVLDVMKKMDMIFYRQYPEYTSIKTARYQFYMMSWKSVLQDLIDKELVLADAEEIQMNVNQGEIRQEMEQLFGPNIIVNLDKAGLSYEEASSIIHDDALIRRMLFFRVNSKVMKQLSPQVIREAYNQKLKEHIPYSTLVYQVISIRSPDQELGSSTSNQVYQLLAKDNQTPDQILALLKDNDASVQMNISNEYTQKENEISPAYNEILSTLNAPSYSEPVAQKSRNNKETVYRIFFLKEKTSNVIPPFYALASELKENITQESMEKETSTYLEKMRKHFGVTEELLTSIPENFEPFVLTET